MRIPQRVRGSGGEASASHAVPWRRVMARGGGGKGGVCHAKSAAHGVDGSSDSDQDFGALVWRQLGEAAGGEQQVQPLVTGVALLPVEAPLLGRVERAG